MFVLSKSILYPFKLVTPSWVVNIYNCICSHVSVWKYANSTKLWWRLRPTEFLSAQPHGSLWKRLENLKVDKLIKKIAELVWNPNSGVVQWVSDQTIHNKPRKKIWFSYYSVFLIHTGAGNIKTLCKRPAALKQDLNQHPFSWLMPTSHLLVFLSSWYQWEWSQMSWNAHCVTNMTFTVHL